MMFISWASLNQAQIYNQDLHTNPARLTTVNGKCGFPKDLFKLSVFKRHYSEVCYTKMHIT